jgi:hypothetical protein
MMQVIDRNKNPLSLELLLGCNNPVIIRSVPCTTPSSMIKLEKLRLVFPGSGINESILDVEKLHCQI